MTTTISRQQRRALQRLADRVGEATDGDRRFFERFPHRQHRVRRMAAAEIESLAALSPLYPVAPDVARYTVVRNIAPGVRMRAFVLGPASESGDESGETIAAALWDRHQDANPRLRAQERALEAAARGPGGPLDSQRGTP